jgi:hydrogenase maturation factor
LGEDASLVRVGNKVLVAATDPITGSVEDVGWLAVHVNANDVATFGISPRWFLVSIILPPGCTKEQLAHIMQQIDEAAQSLDIAVIGGHTEITEGIDRPIVAGFMMGLADDGEYVTSAGAKPGDLIIMTKYAGLEGTSILATEGKGKLANLLEKELLDEATGLRDHISVVSEGLAAFRTGKVTAMHDPTEGGVANGIHEICDASGVGCQIELEKIPIHKATRRICETLAINPLELISSGSMLLTCPSDSGDEIVNAIQSVGVSASIIGTVISEEDIRTTKDGMSLHRPSNDALWTALHRLKGL